MLDLAWHKSGERYIVHDFHKKDPPPPPIFTRADVDCKIGMKMEIHPPPLSIIPPAISVFLPQLCVAIIHLLEGGSKDAFLGTRPKIFGPARFHGCSEMER